MGRQNRGLVGSHVGPHAARWRHTELLEVGQLAVVLAQMGALWWQNRIPKQTSPQSRMVLAM